MRRLLYSLLVGFVGAGIVHIALVLHAVPASAEKTWAALSQALPLNRMTVAPLPLFAPDPFFRRAACRFDLSARPVAVQARGAVSAWFLSVYAPNGTVLAGLSDANTQDGRLDLVILAPSQLASMDATPSQATPVEVDAREAMGVLEVFVPDASWSAAADEFLASAGCRPAASAQ